jgi:BirA family transcriptional regulator, biotin operon repressor / biotin---[acetyl-CoA-carboxylase] ligase
VARCRDGAGRGFALLTIFRVAETGSTNADMLAMAARGEAREGDWLIAERQTAGRGRMGRAWESPPGNFCGSGLVELRDGDPPAPTLALVAGVASIEALAIPELLLKWPNDIVHSLSFAKVSGILIERRENYVVIGVGANLAHAPDLTDRATAYLTALGSIVSPAALIDSLAACFAARLLDWRTDASTIFSRWSMRAHPIGTPLAAEVGGVRVEGAFGGLTEEGALRLRLPAGDIRVIHAGDVILI